MDGNCPFKVLINLFALLEKRWHLEVSFAEQRGRIVSQSDTSKAASSRPLACQHAHAWISMMWAAAVNRPGDEKKR